MHINQSVSFDADIIDYETADNPAGLIDLSGTGSRDGLLIPVFILELKKGRGRRCLSPLETHLRDVLCFSAVRSIYGLEALGFTAPKAREMVGKRLSTIHIEKAIRYGRKASIALTGSTAEQVEAFVRKKYQMVPHLHGSDRNKAQAVEHELFDLRLLDRAYSRAHEMMMGLYAAERERSPEAREKRRIEAMIYRNAVKAPELAESVGLSLWTHRNVAWLWPSLWFYRLVLDAVAAIGPMQIGREVTLTLTKVYVLWRICQGGNSVQPGHEECKMVIRNIIDTIYGLERFSADSEDILRPYVGALVSMRSAKYLESFCNHNCKSEFVFMPVKLLKK